MSLREQTGSGAATRICFRAIDSNQQILHTREDSKSLLLFVLAVQLWA